jgi:hypothetical protein
MKPHVENPYGFLKVFGRELGVNLLIFVIMIVMFYIGNEYMVNMTVKSPWMFSNLVIYDVMMGFMLIWVWITMHHNALLFIDELAHCLFKTKTRVSLFG